jgi:hypothetical protein
VASVEPEPEPRMTLSPAGLREHVLLVGHTATREDFLDFWEDMMDRVYVTPEAARN